jgi:hypothetical protein
MRFIDVDLQPGKAYEYRVQIKMTNPNYGKKEGLAWPALADDKVLKSDWVEVRGKDGNPLRVVVPKVLAHYYAVDQKTLDPKYKGMNAQINPRPEQAVFQVHRWYDFFRPAKTDYPVGNWLIAERLFGYRGESLGQKAKTKVPFWSPEDRGFVLAKNTNLPPRSPEANLVEIEFGTEPNEAPILVDFQGGANQPLVYKRLIPARAEGEKSGFSEVRDNSPMELVLLSPEGKLLARNSVTDEADSQRKERHDNWIKHIKEVEDGNKGQIPFGKPGDRKGPFD